MERVPRERWRPVSALLGAAVVLAATLWPSIAQADSILTPEQEAWLDERDRTIVLGADDSYPPYAFFDDDGRFSGISAAYIALIEERLDIGIETRQYPQFSALLAAAAAREVDVVPNVVASENRPYLVFSDVYVQVVDRIIVRSDDDSDYVLAGLRGRRVAAVDGYEVADFIAESFPMIELVRVTSEVAGLRALSIGEVDALVADLGVVSYDVREEGITNLRVAGSVDSVSNQRFGVRSDEPILRDILDAGLATITEEERAVIERTWIRLGVADQPVSAAELWTVAIIAFVSVLAAVVVLVWNRTLRRMVDRNTEDLRRGLEERDLTEAQRSRLELAISNAAELVVVIDADWSVRYLNPTYERVSGRGAAGLIGQPLDELLTADADRDTVDDARVGIERAGVWSGRLALRGAAGTSVPVEGAIASFTLPSGEPGGFVGTLRDVTHEEELRTELQRAERLRSVGTLAAGIAHDFNNLLTPILGAAELVAATDDERARSHYLQLICDAAIRAAELVELIRLFSLEQEIEPECFDLRDIVNEAVELIRHTSAEGILVECRLAELPVVIEAVASQLYQLVMNLLSNALQAIGGEGRLRVELYALNPDGTDGEEGAARQRRAELVVSDTGVGFDDQVLQRLFEPYFTTRASAGGTGLGLFAVAGIVRTLDGEIDVESDLGNGTTIRVRLPIADETIVTVDGSAEDPVAEPPAARMLVVDDDAIVLDVLESMLGELGYAVTACSSAAAALERFDSGPDFDLLLTDLGMPDVRGDELARQVRDRCPGIPIVMLTGHYDTEELDQDWTVLAKPIRLTSLDEAIRRALDATAHPDQRRPVTP